MICGYAITLMWIIRNADIHLWVVAAVLREITNYIWCVFCHAYLSKNKILSTTGINKNFMAECLERPTHQWVAVLSVRFIRKGIDCYRY